MLDAREVLNVNKAPLDGRRLVMSPTAETAMLKTELFVAAQERGDGGAALTTATLGRSSASTPSCARTSTARPEADSEPLALTGAEAAGYAALNVTITGTAGEFVNVAGNDQPTWMTDATTGAIVLNEPLKYGVEAGAVVTHYKKCAAAASYVAGYSQALTLSGYTAGKAPQVGQLLAFGTGAGRKVYTVIESEDAGSTCTVALDRPLEVAVTAADPAFPGPTGSMNLAFHRDSLALVTRPLALPDSRMGVMAAVVPHNGIGMRV